MLLAEGRKKKKIYIKWKKLSDYYWLCPTRSVPLSDQRLKDQLQLFKPIHEQMFKHFSRLESLLSRLPELLPHPAQPLFSESFLQGAVVAIHRASWSKDKYDFVPCWEKENRAQQRWTWPSAVLLRQWKMWQTREARRNARPCIPDTC